MNSNFNIRQFAAALLIVGMGCLSMASPASAMAAATPEPTATPAPTLEPGEPLSTKSDIVTRDLLYDKATNKQFLTIQDRDGNVFYLVIDYDAPVNEEEEQYQTYFLNPVDADDLAALAEESGETPIVCSCTEKCQPGKVNLNCELCAQDMTACVGMEPTPSPEPSAAATPEAEPKPDPAAEGLHPGVLLGILALIGGGGVLAYWKLVRNQRHTKGDADLEEYDYGDEETEYEGDPAEEPPSHGEQGEADP